MSSHEELVLALTKLAMDRKKTLLVCGQNVYIGFLKKVTVQYVLLDHPTIWMADRYAMVGSPEWFLPLEKIESAGEYVQLNERG